MDIQCEYKDNALKKIIVHFYNGKGGIVGDFCSPSGHEGGKNPVCKDQCKEETKCKMWRDYICEGDRR